MGIYIKDMKMPTSCDKCPFCDGEAWCLIPGNWQLRYNIKHGERLSTCPLIPIPPHGDLIEGKTFLKVVYETDNFSLNEIEHLVMLVAATPIIVPADESKEKI